MVERHVYVKFKSDYANPASREEAAVRSRALSEIPGVTSVRVGIPADESSLAAWDMCIALTFDSLDAVEPYRVHPDHQAFLDDFLNPRAEVKKAWNFEV
ncbi:MAG: Dabb family protein [Myxococcales bacterium]|nr:Dabb family protein [Myxococcales bacterium]